MVVKFSHSAFMEFQDNTPYSYLYNMKIIESKICFGVAKIRKILLGHFLMIATGYGMLTERLEIN